MNNTDTTKNTEVNPGAREYYTVLTGLRYFSFIVAEGFAGGGNWSARRKPPTCRKSLTNFMT